MQMQMENKEKKEEKGRWKMADGRWMKMDGDTCKCIDT